VLEEKFNSSSLLVARDLFQCFVDEKNLHKRHRQARKKLTEGCQIFSHSALRSKTFEVKSSTREKKGLDNIPVWAYEIAASKATNNTLMLL